MGTQLFADQVNHVTGKEGAEAFIPNMNKALASDEALLQELLVVQFVAKDVPKKWNKWMK